MSDNYFKSDQNLRQGDHQQNLRLQISIIHPVSNDDFNNIALTRAANYINFESEL